MVYSYCTRDNQFKLLVEPPRLIWRNNLISPFWEGFWDTMQQEFIGESRFPVVLQGVTQFQRQQRREGSFYLSFINVSKVGLAKWEGRLEIHGPAAWIMCTLAWVTVP